MEGGTTVLEHGIINGLIGEAELLTAVRQHMEYGEKKNLYFMKLLSEI